MRYRFDRHLAKHGNFLFNLGNFYNETGNFMKKIAICAAILTLGACAYQPQPGPTYGRTPADHMLEVGKTLIRADQGTL